MAWWKVLSLVFREKFMISLNQQFYIKIWLFLSLFIFRFFNRFSLFLLVDWLTYVEHVAFDTLQWIKLDMFVYWNLPAKLDGAITNHEICKFDDVLCVSCLFLCVCTLCTLCLRRALQRNVNPTTLSRSDPQLLYLVTFKFLKYVSKERLEFEIENALCQVSDLESSGFT